MCREKEPLPYFFSFDGIVPLCIFGTMHFYIKHHVHSIFYEVFLKDFFIIVCTNIKL